MDLLRGSLQRAAPGEPLWLHDPSGLIELATANLCGGIAAQNAAEVLPEKVTSITWLRDLSRVSGVWLKKRGGGAELGRWNPDWLADASPQPTAPLPPQPKAKPPARLTRGWVLDPIWMR